MASLYEVEDPASVLNHNLAQYFPQLLKFESTPEMEQSELYRRIKPEVERILNAVVVEQRVQSTSFSLPALQVGELGQRQQAEACTLNAHEQAEACTLNSVRAVAWNIERGSRFEGIVDQLKNNPDLKDADVLLLTELDHGMARSGNRFVARELARELGLDYAFAPVYIALQKGSGVEEFVEGENTKSIHGLAMFSKWPMRNVHAVALPNGKDKMWGKEKRIGHLRALLAEIEHPAGTFRAVTVHLDAHCSRAHRQRQMRIILDHLETLPPMPILIGGDLNTTTFNSQNATRAILGYWRRVFMGPKNVAKNHLPHPQRYFERDLFGETESRGYGYEDFNNLGVGTIHYHVESIEKNTNLRDWVPEWCFPFIFWAANRVGGSVSGRLDWFFGKDIERVEDKPPKTLQGLTGEDGEPLSDHDPIVLDFRPLSEIKSDNPK